MNGNSDWIRWKHFEDLRKEDLKHEGHLRQCSKLTDAHFKLTSSTKMRVSLATQVYLK